MWSSSRLTRGPVSDKRAGSTGEPTLEVCPHPHGCSYPPIQKRGNWQRTQPFRPLQPALTAPGSPTPFANTFSSFPVLCHHAQGTHSLLRTRVAFYLASVTGSAAAALSCDAHASCSCTFSSPGSALSPKRQPAEAPPTSLWLSGLRQSLAPPPAPPPPFCNSGSLKICTGETEGETQQ